MQTRKVRKAVIPAAGHGTRFMPITKSVPKEMLVLVDKPAIHYIVEECAESGIEEVAIIVSRGKEAIERYFTPTLNDTPELKALLKKIKITFITQETLNGTGGAILLTKDFVGDEPFAVLFGDDVVVNDVPCIKQLIDAYDETGKTVVGVQEVENELAVLYGAIEKGESHGRFTEFKNLIEKPDINNLPSNLVSLGRFVLSDGIFGAGTNADARDGTCSSRSGLDHCKDGRRGRLYLRRGALRHRKQVGICYRRRRFLACAIRRRLQKTHKNYFVVFFLRTVIKTSLLP